MFLIETLWFPEPSCWSCKPRSYTTHMNMDMRGGREGKTQGRLRRVYDITWLYRLCDCALFSTSPTSLVLAGLLVKWWGGHFLCGGQKKSVCYKCCIHWAPIKIDCPVKANVDHEGRVGRPSHAHEPRSPQRCSSSPSAANGFIFQRAA